MTIVSIDPSEQRKKIRSVMDRNYQLLTYGFSGLVPSMFTGLLITRAASPTRTFPWPVIVTMELAFWAQLSQAKD